MKGGSVNVRRKTVILAKRLYQAVSEEEELADLYVTTELLTALEEFLEVLKGEGVEDEQQD